MTVGVGDYISSLTGGFWKSGESISTATAEGEVTPLSVGATSITFSVIRVPTIASYIKIAYRPLKRRNVESFSFSSAINSPQVGG